MALDIRSVLKVHFVKALVKEVCGDNCDIIQRPAAYFVRKKDEGATQSVERIIILPPHGYTANTRYQANSHDEALKATIHVKGGVRESKQGFSKLKNCLLVASFPNKEGTSDSPEPYLTFDPVRTPNLVKTFHSAGISPFTVVRPDGFGFYHNLINVSDDWLVLKLKKNMRPQKRVNLDPHLLNVPLDEARLLRELYDEIIQQGDGVFQSRPELVQDISSLSPRQSLAALGEMLFTYDTGRHEACTAFAMLLKVGKLHSEETLSFLEDGMRKQSLPPYYAKQLIDKLNRSI